MIHALLSQIPDMSDEEESDIMNDPELDIGISDDPTTSQDANENTVVESSISGEEDTLVDETPPPYQEPKPSQPLGSGSSDVENDDVSSSPITPHARSHSSSLSRKPKKAEGIPLTNLLATTDELYTQFPPNLVSPEPISTVVPLISPNSSSASLPTPVSPPKSDALLSASMSEKIDVREASSSPLPASLLSSHPPRSLDINDIFGPTSVLFTWSGSSFATPSSTDLPPPPPSSAPALTLTDDAAEQLLADGLPNVIISIYDGSSDRDLFELDEKEKEYDSISDEERRKVQEEAEAARLRRRNELIRSSVGLGVVVLVGVSAVILYAADHSLTPGGGSGGERSPLGSKTLGEWFKTSAWAAGFVIGLGREWSARSRDENGDGGLTELRPASVGCCAEVVRTYG